MNNNCSKLKRIAIFLVGISAVSFPFTSSAGWSIMGLDRAIAYPNDINNSGQVVGSTRASIIDGSNNAFLTGANGVGINILRPLSGLSSIAYGINDSGQVVGWAGVKDDGTHAFITGANGVGMTDLGTLGGSSSAYGINDSGQVVGWTDVERGHMHAFITGANGVGMTDLGTLGGSFSHAYGINDSGQVAA